MIAPTAALNRRAKANMSTLTLDGGTPQSVPPLPPGPIPPPAPEPKPIIVVRPDPVPTEPSPQ